MSGRSTPDVVEDEAPLDPELVQWGNQVEQALAMHITTMPAQEDPAAGPDEHTEEDAADDTDELRAALLQRLREIVPDGATAATLVPGATEQDLSALLATARQLETDLAQAERAGLDELEADIESLAPGIQRVHEAVAVRRSARERIEQRAAAVGAAGNTEDQKDRLKDARKAVDDLLAEPLTEQANLDADSAVDELEALAEAIGEEEAERTKLRERLGTVVPGKTAEEIVPGAAEDDLSAVLEDSKQLGLDIEAAAGTALDGLSERIDALETSIGEVRHAVQERQDEHKRIALDGGKVEVSGHLGDQKTRMTEARRVLAAALEPPVTEARNTLANDALLKLQGAAKAVTEELDSLGGTEGIGTLCGAFGVDASVFATLETDLGGRVAAAALLKAFTPAVLGQLAKALGGDAGAHQLASLVGGFGGPDATKQAIASLDPGGQDRVVALVTKGKLEPAAITKLRDDLGAGALAALMGDANDPVAAIAVQKELGSNGKALQDLMAEGGFAGKPKALAALYAKGCGGDAKAFAALCTDFDTVGDRAKLKGLVEEGGLGDAPDVFGDLLATGCGGSAAKLKEFGAGFADPATGSDSRKGLKRLLTTGGLAAGKGEPPAGDVGSDCLGHLAKTLGAGQLATLVRGLDEAACGNVAKALKSGGLGVEPEVFAQLVDTGCNKGDPVEVAKLAAELGGDPAKLKGMDGLLKSGGFGTKDAGGIATNVKPACLAKLFATGCEGKPDRLSGLLTGLSPDDLKNFKGVMTVGDLGQAPDTLGQLLAKGCDGNADKFKAFGAAFAVEPDAKDSQEGLKRLLTTGGLAAGDADPPDPTVDASTLGVLFKTIDGPDLAKLARGLDATACGGLAKTLKAGGLGVEPEVFAHLVKTGCNESDPAELEQLVTELGGDPARLKGLDDLLKTGGFGTKTGGGLATNIKPDCLAKLFAPGCDGKPGELTKLLTALTPTDFTNMSGLMTTGSLGQHPDIVASMYKHGCIADADGADDGTKNPTVLKDMMGEFAPPTGPAAFKDLLDNGGLAEAGKEDRLGSLMRYACSGKAPGGVRDGKVLKQFHTAFAGNMADLKTTIEAFETAPDAILETGVPNQPGKAFRNVVNAPGHGPLAPNATQLHSKFFTKLKTQAAATAGVVIAAGAPKRLTLTQLLQNTPSFEMEGFPAGNTPVTLGTRTVQFRIDHVMDRHTRKFNTFDFSGSSKTTLYPRTTDEAGVKARLAGTWGNIPNPARGDRPGGPPLVAKANPPVDQADLDGNYTPYPGAIPPGLADGQGGQAKIGFNPLPPPPVNTDVYIAQFFAVDDTAPPGTGEPNGGGLLTVHKSDMLKMKEALT